MSNPPTGSEANALIKQATGRWKSDQTILFDNMVNGAGLIDKSVVFADQYFAAFPDTSKIANLDLGTQTITQQGQSTNLTQNFYTGLGSGIPTGLPVIPQSKKPYKNFLKINNKNSLTTVSQLTGNPGSYGFLNIPAPILSILVPRIRLYKVRQLEPDSRNPVFVEFSFEDHFSKADITAITESRRNRGSGAGLVSFDWETLGTNPFDYDKLISARMNLHFQSIKDFSSVRQSKNVRQGTKVLTDDANLNQYKYSELIVPSEKFIKNSCGDEDYNFKYYRIMVDVGWAIPPDVDDNQLFEIIKNYNKSQDESLEIKPQDLRDIIRSIRAQMYLTSPRHMINYNQDGSVNLEIEYVSYFERLTGDPKVDIFRLAPAYNKYTLALAKFEEKKKELEEKFEKQEAQLDAENISQSQFDEEVKKLQDANSQYKSEFDKRLVVFYNSIVQNMLSNNSIYSLDIDSSGPTIRTSRQQFYVPIATNPLSTGIEAQLVRDAQANNTNGAPSLRPNNYSVHYFFLGDLLDSLYGVLFTSGVITFDELRPLVGNFEYYDKLGNRKMVNMADLPISLNLFNLFLKTEFVDPKPHRYILDRFLKKLLHFLFNTINNSDSEGFANTQRFSIAYNMISGPVNGKDPLNNEFQLKDGQYSGIIDTITSITPSQSPDTSPFSYFMLYAVSSGTNLFLEGSPTKSEIRDKNRGIYWIRAGQNVGALKSVEFARNDIPYFREYLITKPGDNRTSNNEGNLDDIKFLKEKYNATLNFFGLPFVVPGQYFYVEPVSFGLEVQTADARITQQLGYDGYYVVIKASHSLSREGYSTTVDARWETSGIKIESADGRDPCELQKIAEIRRRGNQRFAEWEQQFNKQGAR